MVQSNIILIGMPGAGKSTIGVLLAKALSRGFVDTDLVIQAAEGARLQDIIDSRGLDAFRSVEEAHVLRLDVVNTVISTGGSVPYSEKAMAHLKANGVVIYLETPLDVLEKRIANMDSRGIARAPGLSFAELYEERVPLYERYADITIVCADHGHERIVQSILEVVDGTGAP